MTEPSLLVISIAAFTAVVTLLGVLAGMIRILTAVFPEAPPPPPSAGVSGPDGAVVAAIHSAVASAFPGTRVTSIEELR